MRDDMMDEGYDADFIESVLMEMRERMQRGGRGLSTDDIIEY
jgi:hypothetical protein